MKSQIKFDKKFLEGIYKKLTGLVGRTPIHLMAVPGRLKNRLDLCDLSIANVEPDLDLFSDTSKTKNRSVTSLNRCFGNHTLSSSQLIPRDAQMFT